MERGSISVDSIPDTNSQISSLNDSRLVPDAAGKIKNFFPATTDGFVAKCGAVESVCESDFLDVNRRRHLESFKQSWEEWAAFDTSERNSITDPKIIEFVSQLIKASPETVQQYENEQRRLRRSLKIAPSKSQMLAAYELLAPKCNGALDQFLIKKIVRTHSGVVVITVLTSPGSFSCPQDCHYCPNEPGQPRSYLSTEPAVLRANQNGWDPAKQFWDRASTLHYNGHLIDKIEILVLGGTWSGYPKGYQEEFIRDLFYAANTFPEVIKNKQQPPRDVISATLPFFPEGIRERRSLEEEQTENYGSDCRIIGVTLETRPDHISKGELRRLRRFGCTRVQIGIQHTNDSILKGINRGCYTEHAIRAIRLLKDACFKVDIHLMPDLPGSSPDLDKEMFEYVLASEYLQADQWKIYPCEVTPFSEIEKWYKSGKFLPYAEQLDGQLLTQLLVKTKTAVHPWIRLNRVVRDIPNPSIIAGNDKTNLRQIIEACMSKRQLKCRCIRCREVKTDIDTTSNREFKIREYPAFGATDYFLSYETEDESKLFAFLRLRIRSNVDKLKSPEYNLSTTFPELEGCGLVRELHVYGQLVGSKERKTENDFRPQHTGYGKRLLAAAEVLTTAHGLKKMAVIAGVGTTDYYRKFGYELENYYMTKHISYESVQAWTDEFKLNLPLVIQVYNMFTDLGPLNDDAQLNYETPIETSSIPPESPITGGTQRRRRVTKTADILTPLGGNCVAAITSSSKLTRLAYIDHIHTDVDATSSQKPSMFSFYKALSPQTIAAISCASAAVAAGLYFIVLKAKRHS